MKLALVRSTELFGLLEQHGPRLVLQRFQVSLSVIVSFYLCAINKILCLCRLCVCVAVYKCVHKHLSIAFFGVCGFYVRVVHPCL